MQIKLVQNNYELASQLSEDLKTKKNKNLTKGKGPNSFEIEKSFYFLPHPSEVIKFCSENHYHT